MSTAQGPETEEERVTSRATLRALLHRVDEDLGKSEEWAPPIEFPGSLALCALNAAYTLRGNSTAASNVLARYRDLRESADTDSGPDLVRAMDDVGGPEVFATDVLQNKSKLPGTSRFRTVSIHEALRRLASLEEPVTTTVHLRDRADDPVIRIAWTSAKGLGPLSWSYLLMNAGVEAETKPDVMIQRYLARAVGHNQPLSVTASRRLLKMAAEELGVTPRRLDRAIWFHESPFGGTVSR